MRPENEDGEVLGYAAVDQVTDRAARYCRSEREQIEVGNQPAIEARRAELELQVERERELKDRLQKLPPPGDLKARRRKARYYWVVTMVLSAAGFYFSLLTFDPYRLGAKAYLYCLGIAMVTPFLVDKVLELWASPRLIRTLTTGACTAAIVSLVLLAVIRGNVLSQQLETGTTIVVFDDTRPTAPAQPPNFYKQTLVLLRVVMALLAFALEVGAGLALFEARRLIASSGEDPKKLTQELREVQGRMVTLVQDIRVLESAGAHFEHEFWSDFNRALLKGAVRKSILHRLMILPLLACLLLPWKAYADTRPNLVIGIDLTSSVSVPGPDEKSDFAKNIRAVGEVLANVPAGSRVTVFGITGTSFAQPYILLTAEVSPDEGYFKERIAEARAQLVNAWRKRTADLAPVYRPTDLLGALMLASQLFERTPGGRNVLLLFSDMRQNTKDLDLERPRVVAAMQAIGLVDRERLIARLDGVDVYVVGVDAATRSLAYWQSLRDFWTEYFKRAGSTLKTFTVTRAVDF